MAGVEGRARFRRQDLFDTPIREASVVTMYLLPEVNMRLRPRLLTELRPGTRIVSHNFTLGDWRPDATREMDASHIYFWIVPAVAAGEWNARRWPTAAGIGSRSSRASRKFREAWTGVRSARRASAAGGCASPPTCPAAPRVFHAIVEDAGIAADPAAPPSRAGRVARNPARTRESARSPGL